jgi:hypothetical protein
MNERIRELAMLAVEDAAKYCQRRFDLDREENETFALSLAELIVEECAELIDNKEIITAAQTYDEVFVAKFDTKELCAKQIREHFGVDDD